MKKLNLRKIRWILREIDKGELSIYRIAKLQGVSGRWVRKLPTKYKDIPLQKIKILKCGRKRKAIEDYERETVLKLYEEFPMGSTKLEKHMEINGMIHIPHNRIQRILEEAGKATKSEKKIRRKKWVRYERRHSNSLLHADYCDLEGKQIIAYIDDASRCIVGHGIFANATTDNAIDVLMETINRIGTPKQIMTDHGVQFCSNEENEFRFRNKLESLGIEHIMARVKRPQSNGKIERWFGTIKKLYAHFGNDLGRAVACYNNMLHLSLDCTPQQAYIAKKQNS